MNTSQNIDQTTHHLDPLIMDLGLILLTAAIAILIFKKIKQPLVLGYLIAGFLAGPHFTLFPTVKDTHSVELWAEIGVIVLLFSLGLEFSFKKLMKVGGTSSITAGFQIISMIFLGYATGQLLGWSFMDSIFLGAILSMSSTTIILRAFDELGVKGKKFAGIVFGALIVEDIIAILLMVLLSTIAVSQQFSGVELFNSVLKLSFFLILWFVGGIFIIPTLLKKTKDLLNEETLLILSLGLCFMMVILATVAGFSPALGAFIMGSIIAETTKAEKIEHIIKPVKDLFGAVFFVSVGMLINPTTLLEYAFPVFILTLITIFGKTFSTGIGALISGQPLKQSVQAGMSLAQIGEFSFIIATLGMTLNVTSEFLYPIVVAISAITTFTTPFMIKLSIPTYNKLEKILPQRWQNTIANYSNNTQSIKITSNWRKVINANVIQIIIHSVIIIGIISLVSQFVIPVANNINMQWGNIVITIITLLLLSPFLWALCLRRVEIDAMEELKKDKKSYGPLGILLLIRISLGIIYIGFLLNLLLSQLVAIITLCAMILLYFIFPKRSQKLYNKLEKHFLKNFNDREINEASNKKSDLTPWDGHMTTFEITQESYLLGKTLQELCIRENTGVNIAIIKRGNIIINIPNRNERIFPGDILYVIGSDEQVEVFNQFIEENNLLDVKIPNTEIDLNYIKLTNESFIGKSIKESSLENKTGGLIVGIERNGERFINPETKLILEKDDVLWIVGDKKYIKLILDNKNFIDNDIKIL